VNYQLGVLGYWPVLFSCIACDPSPRPVPKPSASVATDPPRPIRKPSASVATDPHATDSLATLMRLKLTTENPFAVLTVQQLIVCEAMRLYAKLGEAEADLRMKGMTDTIYKTRADTIAGDRAESKLAGKGNTFDEFYCASFEAADRKRRADRKHRADSTAQNPR
jgi:hypothetical protein